MPKTMPKIGTTITVLLLSLILGVFFYIMEIPEEAREGTDLGEVALAILGLASASLFGVFLFVKMILWVGSQPGPFDNEDP